jgi:hypothetical protein
LLVAQGAFLSLSCSQDHDVGRGQALDYFALIEASIVRLFLCYVEMLMLLNDSQSIFYGFFSLLKFHLLLRIEGSPLLRAELVGSQVVILVFFEQVLEILNKQKSSWHGVKMSKSYLLAGYLTSSL